MDTIRKAANEQAIFGSNPFPWSDSHSLRSLSGSNKWRSPPCGIRLESFRSLAQCPMAQFSALLKILTCFQIHFLPQQIEYDSKILKWTLALNVAPFNEIKYKPKTKKERAKRRRKNCLEYKCTSWHQRETLGKRKQMRTDWARSPFLTVLVLWLAKLEVVNRAPEAFRTKAVGI